MSDPEPTRLHLLRHGRVARAWQGRIYGDLDVPLAPEGEDEARRAADRLTGVPLAAVVSSGLERTEFGARLLRHGRNLPRRDEPDLREIGRGLWRGRRPEEIDREEDGAFTRWCARPDRERPLEGESLEDLAARVLPRLEALVGEFAGESVAVVAHSWVLRVLVCRVLELPLRRAPELEVPTGALVVTDWPVGGGAPRPTLAGFVQDRPPDRGRTWFRAPRS